jgi:hypothetical protein
MVWSPPHSMDKTLKAESQLRWVHHSFSSFFLFSI